MVAQARRRAGLSQRELAEKAGVPQSTVGRIESGATDPRSETLILLLRACGEDLEALPRIGMGVDRTLAREELRRSVAQRVRGAGADARNLARLLRNLKWADGRR
jgi:transcriptional regulator with XRE-family HTH domain